MEGRRRRGPSTMARVLAPPSWCCLPKSAAAAAKTVDRPIPLAGPAVGRGARPPANPCHQKSKIAHAFADLAACRVSLVAHATRRCTCHTRDGTIAVTVAGQGPEAQPQQVRTPPSFAQPLRCTSRSILNVWWAPRSPMLALADDAADGTPFLHIYPRWQYCVNVFSS